MTLLSPSWLPTIRLLMPLLITVKASDLADQPPSRLPLSVTSTLWLLLSTTVTSIHGGASSFPLLLQNDSVLCFTYEHGNSIHRRNSLLCQELSSIDGLYGWVVRSRN